MVNQIRVAVIDPHPIFLEGVVQAINRSKELELIAGAINVRDMQYVFHERQPDVLVIDNSIPDFETLLRAVRSRSGCRVVVLTSLDDSLAVSRAFANGVHGYVLKGVSGLELVAVIRKVHSGQAIVTAELLPQLLIDARERKIRLTQGCEPLSHREQQVLQHLSLGLSNKEIAELLGLRLGTVKQYVAHLFKKMRVRNRIEAVQTWKNREAERVKRDV